MVDLDHREPILPWFDAGPVRPSLLQCECAVHIVGEYGGLRIPEHAAAANAANVVYEAAQAKDWLATLDRRDYTPARAVDRAVEAGGICVKTFVEPGFGGAAHWAVLPPETLEALRAEARRRGLVLMVHANAVERWRAALGARADVIAHGLWHWPGDRMSTTPPHEAHDVIRAASRAGVGVQPTLRAVCGDESMFDPSLLDDRRLSEALPRALVAYLKSGEGQAARSAVADEYCQAMAKLLGSTVDPVTAMSIAPARATATPFE